MVDSRHVVARSTRILEISLDNYTDRSVSFHEVMYRQVCIIKKPLLERWRLGPARGIELSGCH